MQFNIVYTVLVKDLNTSMTDGIPLIESLCRLHRHGSFNGCASRVRDNRSPAPGLALNFSALPVTCSDPPSHCGAS